MEKEDQERVRDVVEGILMEADIGEATERKVRDLASEKTGINLSQNRQWKGFVKNVITKYFESIDYEPVSKRSALENEAVSKRSALEDEAVSKRSALEAETGGSELLPEEEKLTRRDSDGKKMKETEVVEDTKMKADVSDEEHENDEEESRGGGKRAKYETDEEGNHVVCELSSKRKVIVSQWKGKTLVSMREYYEKDGKVLPTSKGISLTVEQFEVLAKAANDVDGAISSLQ